MVTVGVERTSYFMPEGSTLQVDVTLTGMLDSPSSVTVFLSSVSGTAIGK